MTEKELKQLYWLNRECEKLQNELLEIKNRSMYQSPKISDMPKSLGISDKTGYYAIECLELEEKIETNLIKINNTRFKLEEYIENIEDSEIRLIMRLRHINGMTWEKIGEEINMSESGVFRKYKKYMKKCQDIQDEDMLQ